jgi:acetolactate synthase-1/2/3 large subunit
VAFSIPPTRLIHVDIDPHEIGKNYPVAVGIVGDARLVLGAVDERLKAEGVNRDYQTTEYFQEIQRLKQEWLDFLGSWRKPELEPPMISCILKEINDFLDRDAIVVTSSGNTQAQLLQEFFFFEPNTNLTAGGFSTMGYTLPAAIGAKLGVAHLGTPDRQVIGIIGDGDFLMTMQELHTAMQLGINIVIVVVNNAGWIAITDLQRAVLGEDRGYATEFRDANGESYTPNFCEIARGFGCHAERISRLGEVKPSLERAFAAGKPALVEIMAQTDPRYSGSPAWGWWDVPVPTYLEDRRKKYEDERTGERLA